ncbi:auxilin-related protein 2-like [Prosopis cineraria]|uniref:auxilin-related protein 2-like n=1 Tax=Prosopis cineraria TaxID=364024 RepID=UPI00240FD80A|nr:auxilin-related protein 2-like [Prosopis cineraria]
MNDLDGLLAADFGFKPQGKAAPMAASKGSSNATSSRSLNFDLGSRGASRSTGSFDSFGGNFMDDGDSPFKSSGNQKNQDSSGVDDLLGSSARYPSKSESSRANASFNLDSMYPVSSDFGSKSMNPPVYDQPVYDDDIFDGVPGLKSSSKAKYDDVFASVSSAPGVSSSALDDLLGGFGKSGHDEKKSEKDDNDNQDFDGLIPGFGGSGIHSERPAPDIGFSSEQPTMESKTTQSVTDDPFKVFEPASTPMESSAGHFADPLEEISKFSSGSSTKNDSSSNSNGRIYDDIDPFDGLGKSVPAFSSERNNRKDTSHPRTNSSSSWTGDKEPDEKSFKKGPERPSQDKFPVGHDREFPETPFDGPAYSSSSDSNKPVGQQASSPSYNNDGFKEANIQGNTSPNFEENLESFNDVWLTVSEIPLFTQPTAAPPPSRPPPPRPVQVSKSGPANARRKAKEFSSFPSSTGFSQGPKSSAAARASSASPFDECGDFSVDKSRSYDDEHEGGFPNEELEMNSAAAAMKEAMDRAEAKFRHAKEVRERESTKAARSREAGLFERDERAVQEEREKQEKLDRERQQREREERERRRLEREREEKEREKQRLEREREMARHAVERATREARERAAAEARQRAERAAVGKANAEARERAERAAVQRAQAEARERAAAEAKERAERAAAEARERAEAKEREARDRRVEAESRARAERAAVERAATEARERAAAEARERAAAAARVNQQKNENDLESFFGMGTRASSAPRPPRASSSDSLFDTQFQADVTRKSTGASTSMKKASSSVNIVDDLSSIFGAAASSGEFQDIEGETEERRRARLDRHQRTQERAAKALAEKNQRDLQTQREQAERHRIAETLDIEIKRWAAGKEGNLRALLSTLQYVLWPECGWQPVSLTDLITAASVKKAYRKATLCIHPDKVQQKGANLQQKYVAEKVFDLLKEAWNKFNSEELF